MEKNRKIVLICFLGISCLWLLSVLLWAWKTPGEQITYTDAKYYNFNFDWYDEEGNTFNMHEYKYQTSQVDREVTLYYDLPKNLVLGPDYALCFMSRGIDFRVFLEDQAGNKEEIYAYDQNGAGFAGKDIGLTVQFVPIRPGDLGKTLTFINTPRSEDSFMMEMRLTKNHEYLYSIIRPRLTYFLESFFISFFGMATVLYTLFAAEKEKNEKTYYYAIGCTEVILGVILMVQSQLLQILTGKPEYFNVLKYALAVIVTYPLAVHIDATAKAPHKWYSHRIGRGVALLLTVATVGNFLHQTSSYKVLAIGALGYVTNFVMCIYLLVKDVKYRKENPEEASTVWSFLLHIVMSIVIVIDLTRYYTAESHEAAWGNLIRNVYMIVIGIMIINIVQDSFRKSQKARLAVQYQQQARTDGMTSLMNKGAYMEREAELQAELLHAQKTGRKAYSLLILSLDLNDLKKVNDTYGHSQGDTYIKNAARILKESVEERGEVYRVGGDEFAVLLMGEDLMKTYEQILEALIRKTDDYNRENPSDLPLSFAYGYSICSADGKGDIYEADKKADQNMYECKRTMKGESGR